MYYQFLSNVYRQPPCLKILILNILKCSIQVCIKITFFWIFPFIHEWLHFFFAFSPIFSVPRTQRTANVYFWNHSFDIFSQKNYFHISSIRICIQETSFFNNIVLKHVYVNIEKTASFSLQNKCIFKKISIMNFYYLKQNEYP